VVEDVGEGGVEVALELELWEDGGRPVGGRGERLDLLAAAGDDLLGVALEEDLADELGLGGFGVRALPGGLEGFRQGEVLLCYGPAGYPLFE
jgi:hypothetical protein